MALGIVGELPRRQTIHLSRNRSTLRIQRSDNLPPGRAGAGQGQVRSRICRIGSSPVDLHGVLQCGQRQRVCGIAQRHRTVQGPARGDAAGRGGAECRKQPGLQAPAGVLAVTVLRDHSGNPREVGEERAGLGSRGDRPIGELCLERRVGAGVEDRVHRGQIVGRAPLDGVAAVHARQGQRLEIALGIGVLGETAIGVERELMLIPVGVRQSAHEASGIVRQSRNRAVGRLYAGQIPVGIDG